ncbi:MAG: T9SS type A sorting domain-containing protein [Bacteroidia bacterium]
MLINIGVSNLAIQERVSWLLIFPLTGATAAGGSFPITLTDFSANLENEEVLLNWETANEQNSKNFEIQKSLSNGDFATIGTVDAAGNSENAIRYSFVDEKPVWGQNLYRLKMVDIDGQFTYSEVRSVLFHPKPFSIRPIPTDGTLYLDFSENWMLRKTELTVDLIDATGRLVERFELGKNDIKPTLKFDLSDKPKGIYFLKTSDKSQMLMMTKLIKI